MAHQMAPRDYLQWLYTNCWNNHFSPHLNNYGQTQQFCVVTLDQIDNQDSYGDDDPYWKAVSWAESGPQHTEAKLLEVLPDMIIECYQTYHEFPRDIYLFTFQAPCAACIIDLRNYIPDLVRDVTDRLRQMDL